MSGPINLQQWSKTQWAGAYRWIVSKRLMVPESPEPLLKPPPMFGQITEFRFIWEIQFFVFWWALKKLGAPRTLFGLNRNFWRVILLILFDPSYSFGATDGKIAIFRHNQPWKSPKMWLGSESGKWFLQ